MQMRVLGASAVYLAYGTRIHMGGKPTYDQPLAGRLVLRVFKIKYSSTLWTWIEQRLEVYRRMLAGDTEAVLPRIHSYTRHIWFESTSCRDVASACRTCREHFHQRHPIVLEQGLENYLPPCPAWSVMLPTTGDPDSRRMWVYADE